MKYLPNIAGALLGLAFIALSLLVLLNMAPAPEFPADSPVSHFFMATGPTGFLKFVKICELIGGILVAIPVTRNFGLVILGPILVNIVAFHVLIAGDGLNAIIIVLCLLLIYLLWAGRDQVLGLLNTRPSTTPTSSSETARL